jgi:hypothetical protein
MCQCAACSREFEKGGEFIDRLSDNQHSEQEILVHAAISVSTLHKPSPP